jgi:hypothetical protein
MYVLQVGAHSWTAPPCVYSVEVLVVAGGWMIRVVVLTMIAPGLELSDQSERLIKMHPRQVRSWWWQVGK